MLEVDFASPNERIRRRNAVTALKQSNLESAKKAQIESQISARKKAQKRKDMTEKRAAKRKRQETTEEDEPETKKKKNEGRIIDFTERDFEHVKRLFATVLLYFGNLHIAGLVCGYDCSVNPSIVYPIFVSAQDEKKQSVYTRKFLLGVGRAGHVFTGIRQAFTELYPELPADRVYDWKLFKWNKKAYKAVTVNVAPDPGTLSQRLFSSKCFGGAKPLPDVKVTDEISSTRKMENAIEVARYIKDFVPDKVKSDFPEHWRTWSISDIRTVLEAVSEKERKIKEDEERVQAAVGNADIIKEAFEKIQSEKAEPFEDSESGEYSDESE